MRLSSYNVWHKVTVPSIPVNPFIQNKHVKYAYNPFNRLHWFQGGDAPESGAHYCWEWDSRLNALTLSSTWCHAAGEVTPSENDERPTWYDRSRRKIVIGGGYLGGSSDGLPCLNADAHHTTYPAGTPEGSTMRPNYMLSAADATRDVNNRVRWIVESATRPTFSRAATYDPVRDEALGWVGGSSGQIPGGSQGIAQYNAGTLVRTRNIDAQWAGEGGGWTYATYDLDWTTLDPLGRKVYALGGRIWVGGGEQVGNSAWFTQVDIDNATMTHGPHPAVEVRPNFTLMTWDAQRRVVFFARTLTVCGVILDTWIFNPRTQVWTQLPMNCAAGVTGPPMGNILYYDPDEHIIVLTSGGVFCPDEGYPAPFESDHRGVWMMQLGPQ